MRTLSILLLVVALVGFAHGIALNTNHTLALKALYSATNGASWTIVWDLSTVNTTFCGNNGGTVTCDTSGNVRSINLVNNNLVGTLPTELGFLSAITTLSLSNNFLTSSIPTELGKCTKMLNLPLFNNQLSGAIPTELGNLKSLGGLFFYGNKFSGSFPSEVALLPVCKQFHFYDNQFSTLPGVFGASANSIRFENNALVGNIPTTLFTPVLTLLRLSTNKLSGPIPTQVGLATSLQDFFVLDNALTGTIPTELAVSGVKRFWSYVNQLSGSIPSQLASSKNLYDIRVMGNQLTGSIPSAFGTSVLQFLWLSNNQMSGTIPTELLAASSISSLRIGQNFFSGQIPKQVLSNPQLQSFTSSITCISPITNYANIIVNDFYSFIPNPACNPTVIGRSPSYPTSALATVLKYQFSTGSSLADTSGSSNPLVKIAPAAVLISINIGQAYNPLNGAVVTTSVPSFALRSTSRVTLTSFSVELLFSVPSVSTVQDLFGFSSTSTGSNIVSRVTLDSQFLKIYSGVTLTVTSSVALVANRMYHVVLTYSSVTNTGLLYLDGVLVATALTVNFAGNNYLVVARTASVALDELYVYSSALTNSAITAHYNSLEWCANACTGTCTPTPAGNVCS